MKIFPAIDILDGKAVRLKKGDYQRVTVYGRPEEMSAKWTEQGAEFLHIVDLNGARGDSVTNKEIITEIASNSKIAVQIGGGIRTMSDITYYIEHGVTRVILGSVCINDPRLVEDAVKKYGNERIACGIDSRNGAVAVNGWQRETDTNLLVLCAEMKKLGVTTLICTDILRDGVLSGANTKEIQNIIQETKLDIIASGGINTIENLIELKNIGAYGAILGTALYENKISLSAAISAAKEQVL